MHGWRGVLVLAAALVVTATGCLRAEVGVKVNDDRSGTVVVDLLVDKNNLESAGIRPDQLEQVVKTAAKAMPGADVSTVDDDEQRGVHVEIPFDDYRQAVTAFTNFTFQNQPLHMFQELNIQEGSEGHWSMDATVDQAGILTILAQLPKLSPIAPLDPEDTEIVFSMTLPGEVERSNAYTTDGGTATWKLTGKDASTQLSVDNEPSSLDPLQIALIAVGGLLVVGFVLVLLTAARGGKSKKWVRRRRRRRGPDPAEQWKPTKPTPGTLGGRDESVLPVLPTGAPELPVIPPIGAGAMEGPRVAGVPTPAAEPVVDVPPVEVPVRVPEPVPEPVAPTPVPEPVPEPVAPTPTPVPEPVPEPVAPTPVPEPVALEPEPEPVAPTPLPEPEPVAPAPVEPQPASPQPYVVLSEWAMSDEGAVPVQWTMSEAGATPVEQAVPAAEPPSTSTTPPTDQPSEPTQGPDGAHWLAPQPHQDPEGHWLDVDEDEDAADPTNWPAPPPREDVRVRHEKPGDVEL